ncbi:MAG: hypothetical protein ACW987_15325 [Candidatus Thorarchaeota archaeon]|jgi:hypothetical protein
MELKDQDPTRSAGTRIQYGIYPDSSLSNVDEGYVKYELKLQDDLDTVFPEGELYSRMVTELKETGSPRSDFRWYLMIRRAAALDDLFWGVRATLGDLGSSPKAWECNSDIAVPLDEWFTFEIYWKMHATDGRIWAAINGDVITDYEGQTSKNSGVYAWWPMKVYTGSNLDDFDGDTFYQWVDDIVFEDGPPAAMPEEPEGEGVTFECTTY